MPWNDASGPGPWGAPNKTPRKEPPKPAERTNTAPPKANPPDLSELMRRPALAAGVGVLLAASVWSATGYYNAKEGEQAAIYRFGRLVRVAGPGSGYHLPSPLGSATIVPVKSPGVIEGGAVGQGGPVSTADGRLAEVRYAATYRITNVPLYLRSLADPKGAVGAAVEAAVNAEAAKLGLQTLKNAGPEVAARALPLARARLAGLRSGVSLDSIKITAIEPPREVREDPDAAVAAPKGDTPETREAALKAARDEAARIEKAAADERAPALALARTEAAALERAFARYGGDRERLRNAVITSVLSKSRRVIVDAPGKNLVLPPEVLGRAKTPPPARQGGKP
ncbi:MAG: SPFH domain-containing protein [Caulobacteraceae bacterium]